MTSAYKRETRIRPILVKKADKPKPKFDEFITAVRTEYSILSEEAQADLILRAHQVVQDAYHRGFSDGLIKRK